MNIAELKRLADEGKYLDIKPNGDVMVYDKKPRPTIREILEQSELEEAKALKIWWGYDPARGSDQSALCFRKGNSITGILFGETADYVYEILNKELLSKL